MSSRIPHAYRYETGLVRKQNTTAPDHPGSGSFRPGIVYRRLCTFRRRHVAEAECQHLDTRANRILYVGFWEG